VDAQARLDGGTLGTGLFGASICNTGHDGSGAGRDAYSLLCYKERVATEAYDRIAWINKFTRRLSEVPDSGTCRDICCTSNDLHVGRAWGKYRCHAAGKQQYSRRRGKSPNIWSHAYLQVRLFGRGVKRRRQIQSPGYRQPGEFDIAGNVELALDLVVQIVDRLDAQVQALCDLLLAGG
jgi:hypothetical protein